MKGPRERVLSTAMRALLQPNAARGAEAFALTVAVGHEPGRVTISMPRPAQLINLTPEQADAFGQALLVHAREARGIPSVDAEPPQVATP
jgi:hypothetical protein